MPNVDFSKRPGGLRVIEAPTGTIELLIEVEKTLLDTFDFVIKEKTRDGGPHQIFLDEGGELELLTKQGLYNLIDSVALVAVGEKRKFIPKGTKKMIWDYLSYAGHFYHS